MIDLLLQTTDMDYQLLFEHNPQPMWLYDIETLQFLAVNESAIEKYGYTREEFLSMTIEQIRPAEDVPTLHEMLRKTDLDPSRQWEWRHQKKDGSIFTVEIRYRPTMMFAGRKANFILINDITERLKAKEALILSEERFRKLMETTTAAIFFYFNDRFHYVNQATEQITGYTKDELAGMNILQVVHPDDRELVKERAAARLRGEKVPTRYELKVLTKLGETRWIDLSAGLLQMEGKNAIIATGVDITESRKNLEELRRSEELTHRILEAVPGGIIEISADGRVLQANLEAQHCFGLSPLEFLQSSLEQLARKMLWEDGTKVEQEDFPVVKCLMTGEHQSAVIMGVRRSEGGISWGLFTTVPLLDVATGKTNGAVLTFLDITGRKFTEDALRESEERYRKFFEEDITGDYIASTDGCILACNPAFANIFGFESVESAMFSNLNAIYAEPHTIGAVAELLRAKKKIEYHESVGKRCNGKPVYIIENLIGLFDDEGILIGIKGYVFDNTAHKLLEQQMQETVKIEGLGRLAGGIAHDFNNLLGIILGYTERLTGNGMTDQRSMQDVKAIHIAAQRGANLVRQLLTFARKTDVAFEEMNVNSIVDELGKLLKETFPKNIVLKVQSEAAMPPIIGDVNQIHQAVLNLCVNARDAMPAGGTITLRTETVTGFMLREKFPDAQADFYANITVKDTGSGMDEEVRSKIFEPFFSTKGPGKGTGLGLAVVHGIVNSHHGIIDVISARGKGTIFNLYFPVALAAPRPNRAEEVEEQIVPGGAETILIVEDEELLRELVQSLLEAKGYNVLIAGDGEQAVAMFKEHHERIDLVLSDLGLPKLGGWEACQEMQKINPNIKVVIASGYLDPTAKQDMMQGGVHEFVHKPYLAKELTAKLREMLDERAEART